MELQRSGSLIDRAVACLSAGPMTTAGLAERVLALRGNPRAAAAAVFALLGSDSRFVVDGEGVWSLNAPKADPRPRLLRSQEWVVVDVETTGGAPARGHRIIEIAAIRVSGGRITGEFSTLVNPRRTIPYVITRLTGIDNDSVAAAPEFDSVAPAIMRALDGRVFVGHNVGFDWRFVCAEMQRWNGHTLAGRTLCTLRLARRVVPHLPSRSLGALADYFGIEMAVHHRAREDALATAHLLIRLLDALEERNVTDWESLATFLRKRPRRRPRRSSSPRSLDAA